MGVSFVQFPLVNYIHTYYCNGSPGCARYKFIDIDELVARRDGRH